MPGDDHDINVVLRLPTLAGESLAAFGLGHREQHHEIAKKQHPLRCTSRAADADGLAELKRRLFDCTWRPAGPLGLDTAPWPQLAPAGRLRPAHDYDISWKSHEEPVLSASGRVFTT